jgi:hypothetical protein
MMETWDKIPKITVCKEQWRRSYCRISGWDAIKPIANLYALQALGHNLITSSAILSLLSVSLSRTRFSCLFSGWVLPLSTEECISVCLLWWWREGVRCFKLSLQLLESFRYLWFVFLSTEMDFKFIGKAFHRI